MNTLKKVLLVVAVTICFSMTASAQRDKPPPKEGKPPVIPVQPKPTPDKPKDDRKRPQSVMFYIKED